MNKKFFSAIIISISILAFNSTMAQKPVEVKTAPSTKTSTPTTKNSTTAPTTTTPTTIVQPSKNAPASSPLTESKNSAASKEYAAKVNEWMKVNIGTDEMQGGRINVAATLLISKVREIRSSTADAATKKSQIQFAMKNYTDQLKSVLVAEQFESYQSKKQDLIKNFSEMGEEIVISAQ